MRVVAVGRAAHTQIVRTNVQITAQGDRTSEIVRAVGHCLSTHPILTITWLMVTIDEAFKG